MKIIAIIPILLIISTSLFSQKTTIGGFVYDDRSNEKLIGATIWNKANKTGTSTNAYGYFSLSVDYDSLNNIQLVVSYIGYEKKIVRLNNPNSVLQIGLISDNTIKQVNVYAKTAQPIEKRNETSIVRITAKDLEILPAIGGERDIIKAYQLMPGVQSGSEASSGLYVRGGSPDQNLMLLDDVPIYYVNHLGGFTGIFNSDAINSSKLIKGGFPAQYGSRLSSVLDIKMKEGNNKEMGGGFTLGLLSSKIMLEGPIIKGKTSYLISARRFMYDLLMRLATKLDSKTTSTGYTFYDINAKINHIFNYKNRLYLSFYTGDDAVLSRTKPTDDSSLDGKYTEKWGNTVVALRWNHLFNTSLFSNTTASFTQYRYKSIYNITQNDNGINKTVNSEFYSGINDFSIKYDFEYRLSNSYNIKLGIVGIYHQYSPGISSHYQSYNNKVIIDDQPNDSQKLDAIESGIYIENRLNFNSGITANIGLRFATYSVNYRTFASWEPRLLIGYLISNKVKIGASFSKMQQSVHLLSSTSAFMPVDFWMPATDKTIPSQSYQYTVSASTTVFKYFEFSTELYYKQMYNLIAFKEGVSYTGIDSDWEQKVERNGTGIVYGAEFLLQKKIGNQTGWIAYTLSKNTRQFDNINNGQVYPYKYDRTHDISVVYNYRINKKIDFSATWVYGTGNALTFPSTKYTVVENGPYSFNNGYNDEVYVNNGKNSVRAHVYHRLDIGFNFNKEIKWGTRTWNISVYNLYNRKNPYLYYPNEWFDSGGGQVSSGVTITQKSMFPIIPSVSYSIKFK